MKRGFTLIELMVVVSIIAMLSSVVLAGLSSARQRGRDAARIQEVHQIDLAVNLYASTNNHPPFLVGNNCKSSISQADLSNCVALSTAALNTTQGAAWNSFKTQISPYMAKIPNDPCGTQCTTPSGPLGYTYVAPAAMKYICDNQIPPCGKSTGELDQTYQLYATLESNLVKSGVASFGSFFTPPPPPSGGGY